MDSETRAQNPFAGNGKITAARRYAEQNPGATIYIDTVKGMTAKALFLKVAEGPGIDTLRINPRALIRNAGVSLAAFMSNPIFCLLPLPWLEYRLSLFRVRIL